MEPEVAALVSTAANTIVEAMTTAAWGQAKSAVGALWRRAHPDRADAVEDELAEVRAELLAAGEDDGPRADLVGEWRSRLGRLVAADPGLAEDLRHLVERVRSELDRDTAAGHVEMHAEVSDHGQVFQAGGDQHITFGREPGAER